MRLLVAVSSCGDFDRNGSNDVSRQCWLKDCAAVGIDYKIFMGQGQDAQPAEDVVLVDCPDDYGHLTYKTQESLKWAYEANYDFVYRCFPDTYARPERLVTCGFTAFDFYGDFRGEPARPDNYPSGGPGYFTSRLAIAELILAPILGVWRDDKTPYVEDLWTGQIIARMVRRGIPVKYGDDTRFINRGTRGPGPLRSNDVVSTHLSCPDRYNIDRMKEKHREWLNS